MGWQISSASLTYGVKQIVGQSLTDKQGAATIYYISYCAVKCIYIIFIIMSYFILC